MDAPEDDLCLQNRQSRLALVHILQMAFSGELAAAKAYRGHWQSLRSAVEAAHIRRIEEEEWEHRRIVGTMLASLGEKPELLRELRMFTVGTVVALGCFLIGWFWPMYLAGKLENANVAEYGEAAKHATALGLFEFADQLRKLECVEFEHEQFFADTVRAHKWLPLAVRVFGWDPLNERLRVATGSMNVLADVLSVRA